MAIEAIVGGADDDEFRWVQSSDGAERDTLIGDDHLTASCATDDGIVVVENGFDTSLGFDVARLWVDTAATADALIAEIAAGYGPNALTTLTSVALTVAEIDEFYIRIEGESGVYARLDADDFAV
ncbi:hypothetical protein KO516_19555 [Citreicella sp. C3M06]|uniref:hypothetical protein n=1 Tax=Citreicella sp. C3M06 TaxID=2841564 RepID=UPI001C0880FA|nr:hypothetical protein [Citreicella sp. C3M06]MBU2962986.1 hypothetical protein [Citreicella sp. C3M06]